MENVILSVSLFAKFTTALAIIGVFAVLAIICLVIVIVTFKPNDPGSGIYWQEYLKRKQPPQSHAKGATLDDNTKMVLPYHNGVKVRQMN